jgi:hypothetical protein
LSTCARCGRDQGPDWGANCLAQREWDDDEKNWADLATIECRDRELMALRSLLRSVTGKLEDARECCNELDWNDISVGQVAALIDSVLEVLS